MKIEEKFWSRVKKTKSCWNWTAGKFTGGYGCMPIPIKKSVCAHRFSWEIHNGPIPKGFFVCHKCDNPSCVRPDHLFLGTPKDNMVDKAKKGRQYRPTGLLHHAAKINEVDVREIRRLRKEGISYQEIMKIYGLCKSAICNIANRKRWKHLP